MKINVLFISALFFICMTSGFAMEHGREDNGKKPDCDINAGTCLKKIERENITIEFGINPAPVKPMEELLFTIILKKDGKPVTDASVTIDLTMPGMFMGVNRPALKHRGKGRYEGKAVIPRCPHGGKVWKAEVGILRKGYKASVSYVYEVD